MKTSVIHLTGFSAVIVLLIIGIIDRESFLWIICLMIVLPIMIMISMQDEVTRKLELILSMLIIIIVLMTLINFFVRVF